MGQEVGRLVLADRDDQPRALRKGAGGRRSRRAAASGLGGSAAGRLGRIGGGGDVAADPEDAGADLGVLLEARRAPGRRRSSRPRRRAREPSRRARRRAARPTPRAGGSRGRRARRRSRWGRGRGPGRRPPCRSSASRCRAPAISTGWTSPLNTLAKAPSTSPPRRRSKAWRTPTKRPFLHSVGDRIWAG